MIEYLTNKELKIVLENFLITELQHINPLDIGTIGNVDITTKWDDSMDGSFINIGYRFYNDIATQRFPIKYDEKLDYLYIDNLDSVPIKTRLNQLLVMFRYIS